ncbi:MAG: signal recognition particle-docking protein FtsY [Candidatus Latescibacteria bacterium]|nr:signal recognition particle-docking protein FtsY [Candidatus Latescibacterota bacterium]
MLGKFFDKVKDGLARTRAAMTETIAAVVPRGTRLDDDAIDDIEAALIGADMGLETATEIVDELRDRLRDEQIADGPASVMRILEEQVAGIVALDEGGALPLVGPLPGKPYVILIVGVNGAGKTTTAGKLAKRYADAGKKVVMAACDTFRAAAIPQLEIWAERADADLVRAQAGADPAAVAFDALAAAKSRGADVLLVDTAGRLHNKVNLMEELKKIRRSLAKQDPGAPHETLLVLDGTSGQNALMQAREFNEVTELTGLALTKLDGTAKGGIVVALRREMDLPVKLIGVGEGIDDMQPFDGAAFAKALFAE